MTFGGSYLAADPPLRSAILINVESVPEPRVVADALGIVGVVGVAEWGPVNQIVEITSEAQADLTFGTAGTLSRTIKEALKGEGLAGRAGAAVVKAYRAAASGAAQASSVLTNTTPATMITLTAKHKGTRGNTFTVTVETNLVDSSKKDITLKEGGVVKETFNELLATDAAAIAAAINLTSQLVTATAGTTGVALTNVSNQAFTGGVSGSTLTSTEHVAAMAAFEADANFSVFAVDDLNDETIRGTYAGWTDRLNSEGKLFVMVHGDAAGETAAQAVTRANTLDSPYAVAIWGDVNVDGVVYSSAQMASRVAGIIAAAGTSRAISLAQITDGVISSNPSVVNTEAMVRGGVIPLHTAGGVLRLQRGRTTLKTVTDAEPAKFKSLIFVRKIHATFRALAGVGVQIITSGSFVNTPTGRDSLLAVYQGKIDELVGQNIAVEGSKVYLDPSQDNTGETIHLIFAVDMAPNIEQILGRLTIPA